MKNAYGMKRTLIAQILAHLFLDGAQTRQDVTVRMNYAFGFTRRAGSEDDLQRVGLV